MGSWVLAVVLAVLNVPVYIALGRFFFPTGADVYDTVRLLLPPASGTSCGARPSRTSGRIFRLGRGSSSASSRWQASISLSGTTFLAWLIGWALGGQSTRLLGERCLTSGCSCRARRALGSAQVRSADGGQRTVEFGRRGPVARS